MTMVMFSSKRLFSAHDKPSPKYLPYGTITFAIDKICHLMTMDLIGDRATHAQGGRARCIVGEKIGVKISSFFAQKATHNALRAGAPALSPIRSMAFNPM